MPDPKDFQSIAPLLSTGKDGNGPSLDLLKRREGDLPSNFYLIFSVQDIIDFKQDTQRLVRRLSSLCLLVSSCVAAIVALWLLDVVFPE